MHIYHPPKDASAQSSLSLVFWHYTLLVGFYMNFRVVKKESMINRVAEYYETALGYEILKKNLANSPFRSTYLNNGI